MQLRFRTRAYVIEKRRMIAHYLDKIMKVTLFFILKIIKNSCKLNYMYNNPTHLNILISFTFAKKSFLYYNIIFIIYIIFLYFCLSIFMVILCILKFDGPRLGQVFQSKSLSCFKKLWWSKFISEATSVMGWVKHCQKCRFLS